MSIHEKYHQMIDEQVAVLLVMGTNGLKVGSGRLPMPDKYNGDEDIEKFDAWLQALLRWMKINLYSGPDCEHERITITAMFLEGQASIWYNGNIKGIYRQQHIWTFQNIITSLYDRFIHEASIQDATTKFNEHVYTPANGVLGYFYDLDRYASRMIRAPDEYTFSSRYLLGLPKNISNLIIDKGVSAEMSSIHDIVTMAQQVEDRLKVQKNYEAC
jgi:hypothetical protein